MYSTTEENKCVRMIVVGVSVSTREQRIRYKLFVVFAHSLLYSRLDTTRLDCTRRDVKFGPVLTVRIVSQRLPEILRFDRVPMTSCYWSTGLSYIVCDLSIALSSEFCETILVQKTRIMVSLDYYAPPLIDGGIKRYFCLTSDICLSVCRIHRT